MHIHTYTYAYAEHITKIYQRLSNRQMDKRYDEQALHKGIYSSGSMCSISLITKEMQIKSTIKYHSVLLRTLISNTYM